MWHGRTIAPRSPPSRSAGARLCHRSGQRRRARSVCRHRQDARARRSLCPADRSRRRSAEHPRDHVHAQGRGRDARARARGAAPGGRRRPDRRQRWRALRNHIADIQISTIDAFCFGLLREFPLEADVEPGFDIADETEMARFAAEAMDRTLRAIRGRSGADDESLRLLLATGEDAGAARRCGGAAGPAARGAARRSATFVRRQRPGANCGAMAATRFVAPHPRRHRRLAATRSALLDDGPQGSPEFRWLRADLSRARCVLGDADRPACSTSAAGWSGIS